MVTKAMLYSRVGAYKVFYQDLFQLGPGQELESELNGEAAWGIKGLPRGHICDDGHVAESKSKTEGVLNASAYNCILGIVNDCHHWFLAI
ncbi:unnamed protein product [Boreogadus saida]